MKTTLIFKQIDFWAQVLCIVIPACMLVFNIGEKTATDYVEYAYKFECPCQILSCILNYLFLSRQLKDRQRHYCTVTFLFIILCAVVFIVTKYLIFFFLYGMIFIGPMMAAWYILISYREMAAIHKLTRIEKHT